MSEFWYFFKMVLAILGGGLVAYTLWFFMSVSEKEADEVGVITPKMSRDPEILARLERETPLEIKRNLEEAKAISKLSEMADREVGIDGVVRKK